ncbi:MAG: PilZ domain-containing protein [Pseudomonadota bacterium]
MGDTRRWPRVNLALEVIVRFETIDQALTAQTVNISREGLFVATQEGKPIGTKVRIKLRIAETGERFALEGVVVRSIPDLDDPRPPSDDESPGIAVYLTATSAGWARFCERLGAAKKNSSGRG